METSFRHSRDKGFTSIELLVAISILSIVALAVSINTVKSFVFLKRGIRTSYATELAQDKIEYFAAMDPTNLSSANNQTETNLVFNKVTFTRTSTVTSNSDGSRTVSVTVSGSHGLGGRATMATTLPLWRNS